jgi:hypothetical protein
MVYRRKLLRPRVWYWSTGIPTTSGFGTMPFDCGTIDHAGPAATPLQAHVATCKCARQGEILHPGMRDPFVGTKVAPSVVASGGECVGDVQPFRGTPPGTTSV